MRFMYIGPNPQPGKHCALIYGAFPGTQVRALRKLASAAFLRRDGNPSFVFTMDERIRVYSSRRPSYGT